MPFRRPRMSILLAQREQDAAVREVLDEAKAQRHIYGERKFRLTTSRGGATEQRDVPLPRERPAAVGPETLERMVDRMNGS